MEPKNKILIFIEKYYYCIFFALCAVLAFTCFFQLGTFPVQDWDEARHGVNAFEMLQKNNYIANYYNGSLDYWNLKPPISYYFIMLGYQIFGYNALGLRFFSALAYLLLAVIMALFLKKHVGKIPSLFVLVFFAASYIFYLSHFVRAGDADAIFILFVGIAILSLYSSAENTNWLHLTALMFALGFLTKSWHAFFILPIVFFYLIFTKSIKRIRWWQYFTITLSALIPIAIWFFCRLSFDGFKYFHEMLYYDLLNRSSNAIEGHIGDKSYYVASIIRNNVMFVCLAIFAIGLLKKIILKEKLNHFDILCLVSFLCIFGIFTIAKTKLEWYIFPCSVPLYMAGATYLSEFLASDYLKPRLKNIAVCVLFAVCVFAIIVTNLKLFTKTNPNELQNFIASMPYEGKAVYYQNDTQNQLKQSELLCFEWKTKTQLAPGGYQTFLDSPDAVIIMSKSYYESLNNDDLKVLFESTNYVLCCFE